MIGGKIKGSTTSVTLLVPAAPVMNEWGVPEKNEVPVTISGCLIAVATSAALTSSSGASLNEVGRESVTQTKATLILPKGSMAKVKEEAGVASLRNARVKLPRSETDGFDYYEVLGDPEPIDPDICPTNWNLRVTLRRIEG